METLDKSQLFEQTISVDWAFVRGALPKESGIVFFSEMRGVIELVPYIGGFTSQCDAWFWVDSHQSVTLYHVKFSTIFTWKSVTLLNVRTLDQVSQSNVYQA